MTPVFARVLLKREQAKKIGSIHLPADAAKRHASLKCTVLKAGPTCEDEIKALEGKEVLIGRFAGDWLDEKGNPSSEGNYYICQEEDILCVLES